MDLRIPLYLQLKNTLLNRIDNGELLPGERLESERDLAEKYGVNRQTVRSALNVLIEDGVLVKVPYKGTFVAKQIVKPAWGDYDAVNEHRGFSSFRWNFAFWRSRNDYSWNINRRVFLPSNRKWTWSTWCNTVSISSCKRTCYLLRNGNGLFKEVNKKLIFKIC